MNFRDQLHSIHRRKVYICNYEIDVLVFEPPDPTFRPK